RRAGAREPEGGGDRAAGDGAGEPRRDRARCALDDLRVDPSDRHSGRVLRLARPRDRDLHQSLRVTGRHSRRAFKSGGGAVVRRPPPVSAAAPALASGFCVSYGRTSASPDKQAKSAGDEYSECGAAYDVEWVVHADVHAGERDGGGEDEE